jgi:hypothetical protein
MRGRLSPREALSDLTSAAGWGLISPLHVWVCGSDLSTLTPIQSVGLCINATPRRIEHASPRAAILLTRLLSPEKTIARWSDLAVDLFAGVRRYKEITIRALLSVLRLSLIFYASLLNFRFSLPRHQCKRRCGRRPGNKNRSPSYAAYLVSALHDFLFVKLREIGLSGTQLSQWLSG